MTVKAITASNKIYILLCTLFSSLIILSNLVYQKFVSIDLLYYHAEMSAGSIFYPLTFMIIDLISEFYDKDHARLCVKMAIISSSASVLMVLFVNELHATSWSYVDDVMFSAVFGFCGVSFLSSVFALYISQNIDVLIYLWLRKRTEGRYIWFRNFTSTAIALIVDTSVVVGVMSFIGAVPDSQAANLILNSYFFKLLVVAFNVPVFYVLIAMIKSLKVRI